MLNVYIVKDPATGDYVVVKEGPSMPNESTPP
jgi:hypothetical protein